MFPRFLKRKKKYRPPSARKRLGSRLVEFAGWALRVLTILVILALAGGLTWAIHGFLFRSEYFQIHPRDISIGFEGDAGPGDDFETIRYEILNNLRKANLDEGNLLKLDEKTVREAVEAHSKVRTARVKKQYPRKLDIRLELRRIFALALHDPILAVDREGVVVQTLTTRSRLAGQFPYVTGLELGHLEPGDAVKSESLTKALLLISLVKAGDAALSLAEKISEAHCDSEGNLTLLVEGGTEIRFGDGDPKGKMPALETFLKREKGEVERFAYIDLRVEGQVASMTKAKVSRQRNSNSDN